MHNAAIASAAKQSFVQCFNSIIHNPRLDKSSKLSLVKSLLYKEFLAKLNPVSCFILSFKSLLSFSNPNFYVSRFITSC